MPQLAEFYSQLANRCGDLSPLTTQVRDIFWQGNKEMILAGETPTGQRVAELTSYTVAHRSGAGPARAPHFAQSRIILEYEVLVMAGPGQLEVLGGWGGGFQPIVEMMHFGTKWMYNRPSIGFRPRDVDQVNKLTVAYILNPKLAALYATPRRG
jgi:hypothetical protein